MYSSSGSLPIRPGKTTLDAGIVNRIDPGAAPALRGITILTTYNLSAAVGSKDPLCNLEISRRKQLSDLNPGTRFIRADNQSLIASGSLNIDFANNVLSHAADLYPDNFGPAALSEAFLVVNDSLYLVGGPDDATTQTTDLFLTARIKARIVKLSSKDWMAIAIQSTASDN